MTEDSIIVVPAPGLTALMVALRPHLAGETPEARAMHEAAAHRAVVLWHWGRVLPRLVEDLSDLGHPSVLFVVDETSGAAARLEEERRRIDEVERLIGSGAEEDEPEGAFHIAQAGTHAAHSLIALAHSLSKGEGHGSDPFVAHLAKSLLDLFGRELDALGLGERAEDGQAAPGTADGVDLLPGRIGHVSGSISDDAATGPAAVEKDGVHDVRCVAPEGMGRPPHAPE